jgi:hypothetical protein
MSLLAQEDLVAAAQEEPTRRQEYMERQELLILVVEVGVVVLARVIRAAQVALV